MGRPKLPDSARRWKITITPDPRVLSWVDAHVGLGLPFRNRSHAFDSAIARLMEEEAEAAAGIPQRATPDDGLLDALGRQASTSAGNGKGASKTESTKRQ